MIIQHLAVTESHRNRISVFFLSCVIFLKTQTEFCPYEFVSVRLEKQGLSNKDLLGSTFVSSKVISGSDAIFGRKPNPTKFESAIRS